MAKVPPIPPLEGNFSPFPGRGVGSFPSAGDIDIWWKDPKPAEVFNYRDRRRSSYHFFGIDKGTTVWRSDPLAADSQDDVFGVPIGPPDSEIIIGRSDIRISPQTAIGPLSGQGRRRKIYAELHSLRMRGDGVEVLAGEAFLQHLLNDLGLTPAQAAQVFRRSFGDIVSWDLTGDSSCDFPADNHFNVFFAVKFDETSNSRAFTVYNKDPMVVVDLGITSMPPLKRVTIPQFPTDMPNLYFVQDPSGVGEMGETLAGRGGCCAHSVAIADDLSFRSVGLTELAADLESQSRGTGLDLRTAAPAPRGRRTEDGRSNRQLFRKVSSRYIDGLFVPNGVTQITSTGLTFGFEKTDSGSYSDAVRNGISVVDETGQTKPIDVAAPTDALAYQGPQSIGVGLGPNAGITFDIAALRRSNPEFYLVALIALEGMSRESPVGSSVRLRVLVDGVAVPFADNKFNIPGASRAVSIDLQTAQRFVTLVSTSSENSGNGVFALFQFRGFGQLAGEKVLRYSGPPTPPEAKIG